MTISKTKTINDSSSDSSHASPTTRYHTWMPQGNRHVRSWIYTVYGIPPACYHRGYAVVLPKRSPRPHENLQRAEKIPYQQVWYGCQVEVSILHLLGAWSPKNAGADHIHLLDSSTTRSDRAINRGWGNLLQSQSSWDQGGQDWCWMGMGWLRREVCHKYGEYNSFWWSTLQLHHPQD